MRVAKALLVVGILMLMNAAASADVEQASFKIVSETAGAAVNQDLDSWREQRGHSPVLTQLYQSYTPEILYELADSDDIYALQAAYWAAWQEGDRVFAYQLLMRAAALDSTAALIMAGQSLEETLPLLAVAHYLTAALKGEVDLADIQVEQMFVRHGHSFSEAQWQQIELLADLLIHNIASDRWQRLPADWRYPDAYAEYYGLPRHQVSREYLLQRWR